MDTCGHARRHVGRLLLPLLMATTRWKKSQWSLSQLCQEQKDFPLGQTLVLLQILRLSLNDVELPKESRLAADLRAQQRLRRLIHRTMMMMTMMMTQVHHPVQHLGELQV